jgi:hypothetical protein
MRHSYVITSFLLHSPLFNKNIVLQELNDSQLNPSRIRCILGLWRPNRKVSKQSKHPPFPRAISTPLLTDSQDWYLIIDAHGGPTSAISQVSADATSYAHRNATLKYEFYDRVDSGSYPSNGFSFLNGWVQSALNASTSHSPKAAK